jgi:hypothetical protein
MRRNLEINRLERVMKESIEAVPQNPVIAQIARKTFGQIILEITRNVAFSVSVYKTWPPFCAGGGTEKGTLVLVH